MLFELRTYQAQPGRRADLVRIMEEEIIPFQASKGVVIVGSFIDEEKPDTYVWIRRFNDEDHRKELYAAVYQSEFWTEVIAPQMVDIIDRPTIQVSRLIATPTSVIR
jgi:quinol monooxygenase YgiN